MLLLIIILLLLFGGGRGLFRLFQTGSTRRPGDRRDDPGDRADLVLARRVALTRHWIASGSPKCLEVYISVA